MRVRRAQKEKKKKAKKKNKKKIRLATWTAFTMIYGAIWQGCVASCAKTAKL